MHGELRRVGEALRRDGAGAAVVPHEVVVGAAPRQVPRLHLEPRALGVLDQHVGPVRRDHVVLPPLDAGHHTHRARISDLERSRAARRILSWEPWIASRLDSCRLLKPVSQNEVCSSVQS